MKCAACLHCIQIVHLQPPPSRSPQQPCQGGMLSAASPVRQSLFGHAERASRAFQEVGFVWQSFLSICCDLSLACGSLLRMQLAHRVTLLLLLLLRCRLRPYTPLFSLGIGFQLEPVRSPQLFWSGADGQPLVNPAAPLR